MLTMAEVIRAELQKLMGEGYVTLFPVNSAKRGTVIQDRIAAAVAAHLLSDAVVERAARQLRQGSTGDDMWDAMLPQMRAMWKKHAREALTGALSAAGERA